jgi:hypothetical protein
MSEVTAETAQTDQADEASVIQYLQDNPEVLMAYPEVFSSLAIPHKTDGATSLVERQLKLLREENHALTSKIDELVGIARENEELNQRFHRLADVFLYRFCLFPFSTRSHGRRQRHRGTLPQTGQWYRG